jgi:hypothetical protein
MAKGTAMTARERLAMILLIIVLAVVVAVVARRSPASSERVVATVDTVAARTVKVPKADSVSTKRKRSKSNAKSDTTRRRATSRVYVGEDAEEALR